MGVTVREHPKGSGRWVVYIQQGSFRKNKYVPGTKERADQVARKLDTAIDIFGLQGAIKILQGRTEKELIIPTVAEYAKKWTALIAVSDLKRSTRMMYLSNLKHHVIPAIGSKLITEVDYRMLRDRVTAMGSQTYNSGRFRKASNAKAYQDKPSVMHAYSRDSIRIVVMTLRAMFSEAVREKLVPANPVEGLSTFYRKKKQDRTVRRNQVYTLDELYAIEDVLRENRHIFSEDWEFSLIMSRTGMRIGEVRGLMVSDVNFRRQTIEVQRNIPSGTGEIEDSTKTQHGMRTVDMGSDLVAALQSRETKSSWLFPKYVGKHGYKRFYSNWNRAQQMAKLARHLSPHSLRHTYASQMLASGADIAYVSKQLGHASPAITLSIYAHFIPGRPTGTANALDRPERLSTVAEPNREIFPEKHQKSIKG